MKRIFTILVCAAALVSTYSCVKPQPDNLVALKSVTLLQVDNPVLPADIEASIASDVVNFNIPTTVSERSFKACFTTTSDDVVTQNGIVLLSGDVMDISDGQTLTLTDNVSGLSKEYTIAITDDDMTAALTSVCFAAADNSALEQDVTPEAIAEGMLVRVPEAAFMSNLILSLSATENDVISVNGNEIEDSKILVDTSFPIDIEVSDPVAGISKSYVLKVGKVLKLVMTKLAAYTEENCGGNNSASLAVAKDGTPYIAYNRKRNAVGDTPADSYAQVSVVKWDGAAMQAVGQFAFTGDNTAKMAYLPTIEFDNNDVPYVAYIDNGNTATPTIRKFDGSNWNVIGDGAARSKANTSIAPNLIFDPTNNNPIVISQANNSTSDRRYIRIDSHDGSSWSTISSITGLPTVNGTDGVYYGSRSVTIGNSVYVLAAYNGSSNGGYYLLKYESGSWSLVGKDFLGKQHVTSINLEADKDGNLYAMFAVKGEDAYNLYLYSVDKETAEFSAIGQTFASIAAETKTTFVYQALGVNPVDGQIAVLYRASDLGTDDESEYKNKLIYRVIDPETKAWSEAVLGAEDLVNSQIEMKYAPDGTAYVMFIESENKAICLYTFGYEADIIPE